MLVWEGEIKWAGRICLIRRHIIMTKQMKHFENKVALVTRRAFGDWPSHFSPTAWKRSNCDQEGCDYLKNNITSKKHSIISYISLVNGIICFFIVFITPTRIANIGNSVGDNITFLLTGTGIVLSLIGIVKKTEKNVIPIISLILSSSFFIFWIIVIILLFTGQIGFAP